MINRDAQRGPGQGPLDEPERGPGDPIGDNAYPGGSGMTPPTGDMDDPIPETGMPGEPEAEPGQYERQEGIGPEEDERP
jgi:hypothetical protein